MSDSLLTLDPLTLFYWDLIMNSKSHNVGAVNHWVASIVPGPPPPHRSNVSSTTTKTSKTKFSSRSSAAAPPSTAPSSTSESVLTKTLEVSEPIAAQGLYRHKLKAHPIVKKITQAPQCQVETVPATDDEQNENAGDDETGPIPYVAENRSTDPEFARAQDTPVKAKDEAAKKVSQ